MATFHLLVGRPWLYDNHVIYDEPTNTYAFKQKDHRLILGLFPRRKRIKLNWESQ